MLQPVVYAPLTEKTQLITITPLNNHADKGI